MTVGNYGLMPCHANNYAMEMLQICKTLFFQSIEEHRITQEDIKKRMVGIGADGANVNMGANKGLKGLITKNGTEKGCDPSLLYLGWFWVIPCSSRDQ